jgi:uncharacterized protein YuzE
MTKLRKISYEPEADILRIEVSDGKISDALESGNFVMHVDKNNKPVYVEVLNASKFLLKSNDIMVKKLVSVK